jgi:uncharacterized protein YbjT (DUF2867 family)
MERCLITGAAGGIGTRLRRLLKGVYPVLRLSDRVRPADLAADEEFVAADLTEPAAVDRAVAGMQGIIHLGGVSVERPWDESCRPISSASTICSRRRATLAWSVWSSPRAITSSASIHATAAWAPPLSRGPILAMA